MAIYESNLKGEGESENPKPWLRTLLGWSLNTVGKVTT